MLIFNTMKMKNKILIVLGLAVAVACTPEPFKSGDGSYNLATGINGNWSLSEVVIEDRSFPQFSTQDISDYFSVDPVSIRFNAEAQTYTVSGLKTGHPFGAEGFFAFDNDEFPERITITPAGANSNSVTFDLGNMVRSIDPEVTFLDVKSSCDQVYAQYSYKFNRIESE